MSLNSRGSSLSKHYYFDKGAGLSILLVWSKLTFSSHDSLFGTKLINSFPDAACHISCFFLVDLHSSVL